jgi:phage host-nuclease inhibitor protein Gam
MWGKARRESARRPEKYLKGHLRQKGNPPGASHEARPRDLKPSRRYAVRKENPVSDFRDWNDVDCALRRMGEIDIGLTRLEGDMTLKVNEVRAEYEKKAEGLKGERKNIEARIESFAGERKEEFTKVRTKELAFGTISFRIVHRVMVKSRKATVAALETMGLNVYLRITKEPDKEAMKTLDAGTLAKVGASLKTADQLSIEPNIERIADKEAA